MYEAEVADETTATEAELAAANQARNAYFDFIDNTLHVVENELEGLKHEVEDIERQVETRSGLEGLEQEANNKQ